MNDAARRLAPRLWDTDWLMLRGMARVFRPLLARVIRPGENVLDFGCGDSPYRPLVEAAQGRYRGADFGDAADVRISPAGILPLADASVDVVLSIQVLEHVRELETYFAEIRRMLRPGGRLVLSTHGTWLYHPHPEDHWRWTRTGLALTIERHGFVVRRMDAVVGPLATTTMVRLTGFGFTLKRLPLIGGVLSGLLAIPMNLRGLVEDRLTPAPMKADNGSVYIALCEPLQAGGGQP